MVGVCKQQRVNIGEDRSPLCNPDSVLAQLDGSFSVIPLE